MNKKTNELQSLSLSQQRYLERIDALCRKHGHAHTSRLAESLNVRMPSVTQVITRLVNDGLVIRTIDHEVLLTPKGKSFAKQLEARHDILRQFMVSVLKLPYDQSDAMACRLEHASDERFTERLNRALRYLEREEPDVLKRLAAHLDSPAEGRSQASQRKRRKT